MLVINVELLSRCKIKIEVFVVDLELGSVLW